MGNNGINTLKALRNEIDETDRKLIEYFEKRAGISKKIGALKQKTGKPVRDSERELQVIKERCSWLKDPSLSYETEAFMRAVMLGSRRLQHSEMNFTSDNYIFLEGPDHNKIVAYQGIPGSYSEGAALYFTGGDEKRLSSFTYFDEIFKSVIQNDCYGIVPIENSINGGVTEVLDLLKQYECKIVKEIKVREKHCLLAVKGSNLRDIKTIYSHPQAIEESRGFIQKNGIQIIPCNNTVESAKMISEKKDKTCGAIASERAAYLYDLDILASNIQQCYNNITRFAVISKSQEIYPASKKVSIAFCLADESGSLCNALSYFQKYNLNISKIESRPRKDKQWTYIYLDFEGSFFDKNTTSVLSILSEESKELSVLGFYDTEDADE